MPTWWDWKWFFTALVAAYGAILSTYQAIMKRRENRPDVRVTLNLNLLLLPGDNTSTPHIGIRVQNHGFRDVTFSAMSAAIEVKGQETKLLLAKPITGVTFPYTLRPGSNFDVLNPIRALKTELAKLDPTAEADVRAVVWDQLSREYKSQWQKMFYLDQMDRREKTRNE